MTTGMDGHGNGNTRPLSKKENKRGEIDVVTPYSQQTVHIHEPKTKVRSAPRYYWAKCDVEHIYLYIYCWFSNEAVGFFYY